MQRISFAFCAVILFVATFAFSQSDARTADSPKSDAPHSSADMFSRLKTLAGTWKGKADMGLGMSATVNVRLRVTSGGAAILHEMVPDGRADDLRNGDDDPITMLYMDADRLMLTHYCDSGNNRPRMSGKLSPDGKSVEFDFVDLSGGNTIGHMSDAVFTFIDPNHHTEDWTFTTPDDKPSVAHIDLMRVK